MENSESHDQDTVSATPPADAVQQLSDWIVARGLAGSDLDKVVAGLCGRLVKIGVPIWRGHISMAALHPSFSGFGCTWLRDGGTRSEQYVHGSEQGDSWQASPLHHMIASALPSLRRRLEGPDAVLDFEVLRGFRNRGATDWYGQLLVFGGSERRIDLSGMVASWISDRPGGFSDQDIELFDRLMPRLGLTCYRIALQQVAEGLLDAYVGADAGRRILGGQIVRGAAERLSAVILFADLRGFTAVADRMAAEHVLRLLNDRLGAVTDAVEAHGGQVLKFLGDGLLAVFNLEGRQEREICNDALNAAEDALRANAVLQQLHNAGKTDALALDIALHLGDVMYGNVGSARRLDFTVIGPAVNEVSRIESLCEPLGENLLLSDRFVQSCDRAVESLGKHQLRGVTQARELFALKDSV